MDGDAEGSPSRTTTSDGPENPLRRLTPRMGGRGFHASQSGHSWLTNRYRAGPSLKGCESRLFKFYRQSLPRRREFAADRRGVGPMLRRIDFSGILIPLAAAVALSAASLARAQEAPDAKAVWQVNK